MKIDLELERDTNDYHGRTALTLHVQGSGSAHLLRELLAKAIEDLRALLGVVQDKSL